MNGIESFSNRDWRLAPRLESQSYLPEVVTLDFNVLKEVATEQADEGAFRESPDKSFGQAPLYIDEVKSALYRIQTKDPNHFSPSFRTADSEIMVVVDGILRFIKERQAKPKTENLDNTYSSGRVLKFSDEKISMQAVSVFDPAEALILAMYRNDDPKIKYELS